MRALPIITGAHIICVDSMKVYRGMDIGTDKPPPEVRRRVTHHLLDLVPPTEDFNAARFVEEAERVMADLERKGVVYLLEGGTPLYIKALTEGLLEEAERAGVVALHRRLAAVDPVAAARIHPNDYRRIERALEVWHLTGQRISDLQRQFGKTRRPRRMVVLWRARDDLKRRIAERARTMFESGLIEEVERILASGGFGRTASQAAGYEEAMRHLRGEMTFEEAVERTARRHWQLARRQMTWLKRFDDALHVCVPAGMGFETLAEEVARYLLPDAARR